MALLSAHNVTRILTDEAIPVTVVKNADVEVQAGEFIAITGPSGSGKSSLLYLLGLLDKPSDGEILIDGQSTSNLSQDELGRLRLEKMGFIFQFHFLLPEFTGLENVMMPIRRLSRLSDSKMHAKAIGILESLNVGDQAHKLPSQMSGGQRHRVAVARSLANDPVLLLADEPTGNLDSVSSKAVQDILRELAHVQNRAVLAVTHDPEFAADTDRVIHIVDGEIV
ncbi:MAG: ABC transporter ATP-binding protein [Alphaproteobacteria bacterium]